MESVTEKKPLFSNNDFEAFQKAKWNDMVYNLDRMRVKERLTDIGKTIQSNCSEFCKNKVMEAGTEYPALSNNRKVDRLELFFIRCKNDRKMLQKALGKEIPLQIQLKGSSELYSHASLGILFDLSGMEIGFRIPFLSIGDRENLRKVIKGEGINSLLNIVKEFNDKYFFTSPDSSNILLKSLSEDDILTGLDKLEKNSGANNRNFIGFLRKIELNEFENLEIDFSEIITNTIKSLIPLYDFICWTTDNDLLDIAGLLKTQELALEKQKEQKLIEKERIEKERIEKEKKNKESRSQKFKKKFSGKDKKKFNQKPNSQQKSQSNKQSNNDVFIVGDKVIISYGLLAGKNGIIKKVFPKNLLVQVGTLELNIIKMDVKKV
jgi:hypothetical protein